MTNFYELMYILNPVLNDEQYKDILGRVNSYITDNGGEVVSEDVWGLKRLAYPMQKKRNGYYVLTHFKASGEIMDRFERMMRIEEGVLRFLFLKFDAKMMRHYEKTTTAKADTTEA